MELHTLKILEIKSENQETKTYYLRKPEGLEWTEGSSMHIALPNYQGNKEWVRHMSISTMPDEEVLGFTTRTAITSEFKQKLSEMTVGDELVMFKVNCHLPLRRVNRPLIFLSMGVGLAAFRPLMMSYYRDQTNIPKITCLNVDQSLEPLYRHQMVSSGIDYWFVKNRREYYDRLDVLMDPSALYYVVGSESFMRETIKFLKAMGIENEQIMIDRRDTLRFAYQLV